MTDLTKTENNRLKIEGIIKRLTILYMQLMREMCQGHVEQERRRELIGVLRRNRVQAPGGTRVHV